MAASPSRRPPASRRAACTSRSPAPRCTGSPTRPALPRPGRSSRATPDHTDEGERRAWRVAAARQWERLLEMRAMELAPGGRLIAAVPASPAPCPERTGPYVEIIGDMNRLLADWCRAGRISEGTVAAVVVPVWMRTLDEILAPFEAGGGRVAGLKLESAELSGSTIRTGTKIPPCSRGTTCGARPHGANRSSSARSRARARTVPPASSPTFSASSRSVWPMPRPLPLGLHRGAHRLPARVGTVDREEPPAALGRLPRRPNTMDSCPTAFTSPTPTRRTS